MCIGISGRVNNAAKVVLTDIIAKRIVHCVNTAEHHRAAAVVVGIVILVQRAIAPVGIPRLPVLILASIERFIVLEQGIFTFPRPNTGCYPSEIGFGIVCRVNLTCHAVRNIVLNHRTVTIHRGNGIAARVFYIVIFNYNIGCTVSSNRFIADFRRIKPIMIGGIAHRNAPAVYIVQLAVFNQNIVIACDTGFRLVFRLKYREINAAVVHVLIIHIALDIADVQIL